jgi:hypothetical protein
MRECWDVYHALENLRKTGKVLYGEGTEEYKQWLETTKWELSESGFEKIEKRLDEKTADRRRQFAADASGIL